jgi:uncharacterized protein with ATP-grasp and redox domains
MPAGLPLPPLFSTSEPESFALRSIRDRHALSLLAVIEENGVEEPYRSRLLAFRKEALGGALSDPFAREGWDSSLFQPQELADWRRELGHLVGRSWYDLPWYFAEAFFFLALLFAFGYYEPSGPHRLQDPFAAQKRRELSLPGGGLDAASSLAASPAGDSAPEEALRELLLASLWGNRVDLSMQRLAGSCRLSFLRHEAREVLVDQSAAVARKLQRVRRVDFILDNSGPELVCDLMLASWLLLEDPERRIVLHAKRSPFYVSDATASDVRAALQTMAASPQAPVRRTGESLGCELEQGRLALRAHWFWNGPLFFAEMPPELRRELAGSGLVLIKGDANYRRLLGDRKWPPVTRMESLTGYFPAPLAVLRTLKSELVIDLQPGQAEGLDREDPEWRTNGRRGVIRLVAEA